MIYRRECAQEVKSESASRPTRPEAVESRLPSATMAPVPPLPPLTTDEGRRPFPIRLRDSHSRAPEGGGGVCQRPRHAANRCGRRDRHVRLDDRAQADFAPARAHGAKKISVKRGHGRMGMHGRRRKVQRAGGEVCGQSKGALACLFRWPMSGCDSVAIITEVSDSMGSESAACSHLHKGRVGAEARMVN